MRWRCLVWISLAAALPAATQPKFYPDDPLLREPRPIPVKEAANRKLSDIYDLFHHLLRTPGERHPPGSPIRARGVNTLGDPMDGSWWERRHYWRRMSLEELKRGPGDSRPPRMDSKWTITGAKNEGVTPGFTIRDADRRLYFVKFDPLANPEIASGADQISLRLFYALGYHVPENYIVYFRPEQLELGRDVMILDARGKERPMRPSDIGELLRKAPREPDGTYRATASLALPGKPIGPYRYYGTRADDPNDIVPHEHRRDLRGLHVACAWIDHDDSRAINTLDILTEEDGVRFIKHYQLDFGSTLGSATNRPNSPRSGGEYLFGWKQSALSFFSLGLYLPAWTRALYPDLPSVGRFESRRFDPERWVPEYPNPAFRNRLPEDSFWMAKQIVNIRDDEIRAIVSTARYSDPRAADWITQCLIERRDKIGRTYFAQVLPLDRFRLHDGKLLWEDLAAQAGLGSAGDIQIVWARFDNDTVTVIPLPGETTPTVPRDAGALYLKATLFCRERPRQIVEVYLRRSSGGDAIVGVDRQW